MNVGFLGLGAMGSAMALQLIKAGHKVSAWNRSPQKVTGSGRAGRHRGRDAAAGVSGRRHHHHARR